MDTAATGKEEYSVDRPLYLAFELGSKQWKLGFTIGFGQRPRERTIPAGDLADEHFLNRMDSRLLGWARIPTMKQS